ncbi:MAG TPA: TerC family protein [Thermoanaerobaculia bacterium]|nr:TerC family protein [Thermoanaerobaculia bacterium]
MGQIVAGTPLHWGVFFLLLLGMLALDLGVFNRREHRIGLREALFWSVVWTAVGLAFNLWIAFRFGHQAGLEFLTGYIIERALSFDNIFVFVILFNYFAVPAEQQHRVLFWGILGALLSRGLFIGLGTALISRFEWLIFVFGAFLVYTGFKMFRGEEPEVHPEKNPVVRLFQRFVPLTSSYHGKRFLVRDGGRMKATPLLLVLVVIEATDVIFAVDSIPAVFGVTRNTFIIFTSNIFAILGLRALYFLLAGLMVKFRFLGYGVGLVLVFVGCKMLGHEVVDIPAEISLGIVLGILAVSIAASLLLPAPADPEEEAVLHDPAENDGEGFQSSPAGRELEVED